MGRPRSAPPSLHGDATGRLAVWVVGMTAIAAVVLVLFKNLLFPAVRHWVKALGDGLISD